MGLLSPEEKHGELSFNPSKAGHDPLQNWAAVGLLSEPPGCRQHAVPVEHAG